jgi:hypothetical protein
MSPPQANALPVFLAVTATSLFSWFGLARLSQPHACPSSVLVDELDPGGFQCPFNEVEGLQIACVASHLDVIDRISMKAGRIGEVSNGPI